MEVESTDRAIRELWEISISSLQRRGAWKGEQLKEPEWELLMGGMVDKEEGKSQRA